MAHPVARIARSFVGLFVLTVAATASASPGANSCSKLASVVDNAKSIVVAHPTSVTSTMKGTIAHVRVTYSVDAVLYGPKATEIVVEETCDRSPMPMRLGGYPSVANYCNLTMYHGLPGLKEDGTIGTGTAPLMLTDMKSELDGKAVWHLDRESPWGACPDQEALVKKRPALKDLISKVAAAQGQTTSGFPSS